MVNVRALAVASWAAIFLTASAYSQDLSRYREFQFGTGLPVVAKQAHLNSSEARTIHQRPAVVQELAWDAQRNTYSSPQSNSVKEILFSFYNGELFRMVVTYDQDRVAGLTVEDLIEAVSAKYGTATRPVAEITLSSTQFYNGGEKLISDRSEKVLARWEDSQYLCDLIRPTYESTFGLVIYSKRLDALARAAIIEAVRLDGQEAPQREAERQNKKRDEDRVQQEKARRANKAPFRP